MMTPPPPPPGSTARHDGDYLFGLEGYCHWGLPYPD